MLKTVLESLSSEIQMKRKKLLSSLVVVSCQRLRRVSRSSTQACLLPHPLPPGPCAHRPVPCTAAQEEARGGQTLLHPQKTQQSCQEVLLQKTAENQNMVKYADKFREVSGQGRGWSVCEGAGGGQSPGPVGARLP